MAHVEHTATTTGKLILKSLMLKLMFCDYSEAYILLKGDSREDSGCPATPNNRNQNVIFQSFSPFTNSIRQIKKTLVDDAEDVGVIMPNV